MHLLSPCILLALLGSFIDFPLVLGTRVRGSIAYDPDKRNFLYFLTRYGVGKGQQMYAYGTAYSTGDDQLGFNALLTLVLIPQGVWDNFYHVTSRNSIYAPNRCQSVFTSALNDSQIVDGSCGTGGNKDYLRRVPCDILEEEKHTIFFRFIALTPS